MANAVSKEEVKNFLILFRKEMEARIAAKYATFPAVNTMKGDLDTLEDKVADINTDNFVEKVDGKGLSTEDFTTEEKKLLASLAKDNSEGFTAEDLEDIFAD